MACQTNNVTYANKKTNTNKQKKMHILDIALEEEFNKTVDIFDLYVEAMDTDSFKEMNKQSELFGLQKLREDIKAVVKTMQSDAIQAPKLGQMAMEEDVVFKNAQFKGTDSLPQ